MARNIAALVVAGPIADCGRASCRFRMFLHEQGSGVPGILEDRRCL